MDKSFLEQHPIEEVEIAGIRAGFPVRYYDAAQITASFPAPLVHRPPPGRMYSSPALQSHLTA